MYSLLAPISAHVQFCWTSSLNPPGSSLADALLERLLLDCWRSFTQSCLSCFSWLLVQSFFCADGRAVDGMQKKSAEEEPRSCRSGYLFAGRTHLRCLTTTVCTFRFLARFPYFITGRICCCWSYFCVVQPCPF